MGAFRRDGESGMADYAIVIQQIIASEGGYRLTDHDDDRGGQTFAGISRRHNPTWNGWAHVDAGRASGIIDADGVLAPDDQPGHSEILDAVANHYRHAYWDKIAGDDLPRQVALPMMSCAVLSGSATAVRLAQTTLGIQPDGHLGPVTLDALQKLNTDYGISAREFVLGFALARIARYSAIVSKDPSQRKWLRGWINRVLREV